MWEDRRIVCQAKAFVGRPDRGAERRCRFPARYFIPFWGIYVCGIHRRGYINAEPLRSTSV